MGNHETTDQPTAATETNAETTSTAEASGHDAAHGTASAEPPFDAQELAELGQEDAQAGGNIATMLAIFFLYTVIVMALVAWWTYGTLME